MKHKISAKTLCTDGGIFATLLYSDQFKRGRDWKGNKCYDIHTEFYSENMP
jgi:hypothetical protein